MSDIRAALSSAQAGNELGHEAIALVLAVAIQSPAVLFDAELLPLLGISSTRRLRAASDKAVSAGWLTVESVPGALFAREYKIADGAHRQ